MGTRSLTHIKGDDGKTLVTIYRQFDGYPSGMGQELSDLCGKVTLVNGYMDEDWPTTANGMGCLAASLIAELKSEGGKPKIGNVSIHIADDTDCWEEYVYTIYTGPNIETVTVNGFPRTVNKVYMSCATASGDILYDGPAVDFKVAEEDEGEEE